MSGTTSKPVDTASLEQRIYALEHKLIEQEHHFNTEIFFLQESLERLTTFVHTGKLP